MLSPRAPSAVVTAPPAASGDHAEKPKSELQLLAEQLFVKKEVKHHAVDTDAAEAMAARYKAFLNANRTEREAVTTLRAEAEKQGFVDLRAAKTVVRGQRYFIATEKTLALIRYEGLDAVNVIASHLDSPRLDLKPYPLTESGTACLWKTHYYGGIKKFQYLNEPLSLHGVIVRRDGTKVTIALGTRDDEPCFIIPDLAPHVSREQAEKTANKFVEGEQLMAIAGTVPVVDDAVSEKLKLAVMKSLHDAYGIVEADFLTAELCLVPAGNARDVGFDRQLIAAYGHDDRSSVFLSFHALLNAPSLAHTGIAFFYDKEEIGSTGKSGATSSFFRDTIDRLRSMSGSSRLLADILADTDVISADVTSAQDPIHPDIHDGGNASQLGHGVSIEKYGGAGGKYDCSDADAEYMHRLRMLCERNSIAWQTGELARVDLGGGGTIAMFLAREGCDVVDAGVPVLAMHSPRELASKTDLYEAYRFYKAFFSEN